MRAIGVVILIAVIGCDEPSLPPRAAENTATAPSGGAEEADGRAGAGTGARAAATTAASIMTHDFRTQPDGEAAERFRAWLEAQTIDGLRRTYGNAEATQAVIFLFVNRAFEAHMPEGMIGETFGKCIVRAGYRREDADDAIDTLESLAEIARGVHGGN